MSDYSRIVKPLGVQVENKTPEFIVYRDGNEWADSFIS